MLTWDVVTNCALLVLLLWFHWKLKQIDRRSQNCISWMISIEQKVEQLRRQAEHPAKVAKVTELMKNRSPEEL